MPFIRREFERHFPDFTERTKDAIGALTHNSAMRDRLSRAGASLQDGVWKRLSNRYAPEWRESIAARLVSTPDWWVILDDKARRMKNMKKLQQMAEEIPPPLPGEKGGSKYKG